MRTPWVVGIVVGAHAVALGSVFLMQGCGTTGTVGTTEEAPLPPPPAEVTRPSLPPPRPQERAVIRPAAPRPVDTTTYVVAKGDSLSVIASRFGVSASDISALNNIKNANMIRVGQKILLPGKVDISKPREVKHSAAPAASAPAPVVGGTAYTVKSGDSLSVIASRYGTTSSAIRKANNMTGDKIIVGQKLVIPGGSSAKPSAAPSTAPSATKPATLELPETGLDAEPVMRPVAPTSSLTPAPATAPAATVPATSAPQAPSVLPVPAAGSATPDAGAAVKPAAPVSERVHIVEEGEDVYSVAMLWAISVNELKEFNGLTGTELTPGQRLRIPMSE